MTKYISRAIVDRVDPDGTTHGHYGDTHSIEEIVDDYGTLTVDKFDAKYPGWADDRDFKAVLRWECERREMFGR